MTRVNSARFVCWATALCLTLATGSGIYVARAGIVVDDAGYANDKAAQTAWESKWGSAPVELADVDGRRALKFKCEFARSRPSRSAWDRAVSLDMASCRGVQFLFHCANTAPVSGFSFYLRSGGGWYAGKFERAERTGWTTVVIDKDETSIEGTPAGWGRIDAIRISAWRGGDEDTEFHIADMRLVEDASPAVIVRCESAAAGSSDELSTALSCAQNMAGWMRSLGTPFCSVSDLDLSEERLKGRKLVLLPYSPEIPDRAVGVLAGFIKSGGKLICCYLFPPALESVAGISRGKYVRESYEGQFAAIRSADKASGLPDATRQRSRNIFQAKPVSGRSRTAAWWHDEKGRNTGAPAVVMSDNCMLVTHVLLPDYPEDKQSLMIGMVGHFVPELRRDWAEIRLRDIGRFGPYGGADEALRSILSDGRGNRIVADLLKTAERHRAEAGQALAAGNFGKVMESAGSARSAYLKAYCASRTPVKDRMRGFWCHKAAGVPGLDWDESVRRLAENGFTAIFPNMAWGGSAYYASEVLPKASDLKQGRDLLAECVKACRKYGVECHVWKVCWNMGWAADVNYIARMRQEGRTQVGFDGTPQERWLCPSHPANRRQEIEAMVEIARKYDVDGVHFDYIRYPGQDHCFCEGCRARFEQSVGEKIADWPRQVRTDEGLRRKWLEFRRSNMTAVVAGVRSDVRKLKRPVKVSAAVFTNWPADRDNVGQDWGDWCERGLVDFVCPMDYTPNAVRFETMARQQIGWAGKSGCYPGIGVSTWTWSDDNVVNLIEQIGIARELGARGFMVFDYRETEARELAPMCGLGITRR